MQLRPIQESDLPRVTEIFNTAFEASPAQPLEYIANLCISDPAGCLVAIHADEIVGYVCSHRSGRVGYIGTLAVEEKQRRMGFGKALTLAVRDHLAASCDIVGLAVEPDIGRNLELYTECGFETTLPSTQVWKPLAADRDRAIPGSIRTAQELGESTSKFIRAIKDWTVELLPGLDFTRDLEFFAREYPERLWIDLEGEHPRGFMAYHTLFRGDPWGAVQSGPGDIDALNRLVAAVEASVPDESFWFHAATNFRPVLKLLRQRGYRVLNHKTCMVLENQRGLWPFDSDSLLLRPWWT